LYCLHLDTRHRLIAFEELFRGTIDGASVHPREVVRQALARNSAAVILAPSWSPRRQ
jgi:DNA repair protein RadC